MSEQRYYAVRMLWVHDQETWEKYQEMARPILARHDVRVERRQEAHGHKHYGLTPHARFLKPDWRIEPPVTSDAWQAMLDVAPSHPRPHRRA